MEVNEGLRKAKSNVAGLEAQLAHLRYNPNKTSQKIQTYDSSANWYPGVSRRRVETVRKHMCADLQTQRDSLLTSAEQTQATLSSIQATHELHSQRQQQVSLSLTHTHIHTHPLSLSLFPPFFTLFKI